MLQLNLSRIEDEAVRDALQSLQDALNKNDLHKGGFRYFTFTIPAAVTNMELFHNLGYVPSDIIVAKHTGSTYTWNYPLFTKEKLFISTAGSVTIRCFIGSIA